MDKREILTKEKEHRMQEVFNYQINIDNYRLAISHVEGANDSDLIPFLSQLKNLLSSEIIEQKKAKVMLAVITQQLEE